MNARSKTIAVLGAGQIGAVIARMLAEQGHRVTLADASASKLAGATPGISTEIVDASDLDVLRRFLSNHDIVVSALPYFLNREIARIAVETKTHYFDLTEDVATTAFIKDIGATADVALVPQCGLAPGFICVLGADMAARFDDVKTIKMRVGALPLYPTNALRYNVTWSLDGLINEYCNPCEIVSDGKPILAPALEGLESVMIAGVAYEAFNTSGGLGTLADTLAGRVQDLSYKSLRYPGHAEIMKLLLQGLELAQDRDTMRRILARAAPFTYKDVVVIFVTGIGVRAGRMEEESIVLRHYGRPELGAIQLATAAGCVAMVELFLNGKLPAKGFVRQEDATLDGFLATRSGRLLSHGIRRAEAGPAPDGRIGGVERRLAAVLAADVAGYSRLMGADEVGTLAALKALRREIVDPAVGEHHGRIVKTTGDGMFVEFASAVAAVNCAMEVQAKMAERSGSTSSKITFRVGINVGDIIIDHDDIFGDAVNVAARVENECEPGGICLSGSAFEQIRGKTQFTFDDLGERSLKNIDRPIRLYATRSVASSSGTNMVRQTEKARDPLRSLTSLPPRHGAV